MNAVRTLMALLLLVGGGAFEIVGYAGPKIPREKIPPGTPERVREQIERLYSPDPVERAYGASNLGAMGEEAAAAVPFLMGMLDDATPLAVGVVPMTSRERTSPKREAAVALGMIGNRGVQALLDALKAQDAGARASAAEALGVIRISRDVPAGPLIAALKDQETEVRASAALALGAHTIPAAAAVEPLIVALRDSSDSVRKNAACSLAGLAPSAGARIKDAGGVEALISCLSAQDPQVRSMAAYALGMIGDPRASGPLIAALKDQHGQVRADAARALGEMKEVRALESLRIALRDELPSVRSRAAEALGMMKDARAIEELIAALRGTQPERFSAAWALGQIRDGRAVEPLIAALRDDDIDVRIEAALALGEIGDARAVEALVATLEDDPVARFAVMGLRKIKHDRAVEGLTKALGHRLPEVEIEAAEALREIRGPESGMDQSRWQKGRKQEDDLRPAYEPKPPESREKEHGWLRSWWLVVVALAVLILIASWLSRIRRKRWL